MVPRAIRAPDPGRAVRGVRGGRQRRAGVHARHAAPAAAQPPGECL